MPKLSVHFPKPANKCLRVATCSLLALLWVGGHSPARCDEPYERFLDSLRQEQLYDLALAYLDEVEARRALGREFVADLELERGILLFQSAAILPATNPSRVTKLNEAEQALRKFLDDKKNHPRRGEARLKVGELLLQRADEAKSQSQADSTKDNLEAIRFYDEAHQLFESTIEELAGILQQIKGARIDPKDTQKVRYRQKLQQDLRQAQLLSAKSVEERGRSRAAGSAAQKSDLQTGMKMFSDLYSKEQRMVGVRNYALFYRSAIQASLGMQNDAIDGFQRVADLEGVDVLRPLQTNATKELILLLSEQEKFPLAVDRGEKWLGGMTPGEQETPEVMGLRLELAKAKIAWSKQLAKKDPNDRVASRLVRDTRKDLSSMLRIGGAHQEETRRLLGELGVESNEESSEEIPEVKSFAEATEAAQDRIDRAETQALELAVAREANDEKQVQTLDDSIRSAREQAVVLLRQALRFYNSEIDPTALSRARFSLAYLYLKLDDPWSALSVAEFLSRNNPRTDIGLNAAAVALGGLSDLIRTAGEDEKQQLTAHLEPFAEYLVQTWPDSSESAAAASALVKLALINKQWEKIDEYLKLVPATGKAAAELRRDVGLSFYAKYVEERNRSGDESDVTQSLKSQALNSLKLATSGVTADQLDGPSIDAMNAYARLLIADGKSEQAANLIFGGKSSPLKALEANGSIASTKIAMNTYRTAIQLIISQLAAGSIESPKAISQTSTYIAKLQKLAASDPGDGGLGQRTLTDIFVELAKDLKEQLSETKDPAQRKRLSEAMVILAKEAASSTAFNTKYWAADTVISIADELSNARDTRSTSTEAYAEAAQILEQILAENASNPGYVQPPEFATQISLLLAKANSGLGEHAKALGSLAKILRENVLLLDVQMEAARAFQAWGDSGVARAYLGAFMGSEKPDPKTKSKLFWGWGKIARVTEGKEEYSEQFFEARYQLALSRYKYGMAQQDPEKKAQVLRSAEKDITSTAALYPELGGPAKKKRFDALLNIVKKAQ